MYKAVKDSKSGLTTYEFKIRRGYLADNNSPDNLLSYTVAMGGPINYFAITTDVKEYLNSLGMTNSYLWTYNYAYFGSRPETVPETTEPETTEPVTTVPQTTEPVNNGGCNSMLAFVPVAFTTAIVGTAVAIKKKKDND